MASIHAIILFVSYLAFLLAVLTGVLFLIQERRLKTKDPGILAVGALPQEVLDRVNLWSVVIGFVLFSFGMVQAHLLAEKAWGAYFTGDPIEVWTLITWAAYAAVLGLRLTLGLKGRRVVWMSVASFGLVVFTFVGVDFLVKSRHVIFQ